MVLLVDSGVCMVVLVMVVAVVGAEVVVVAATMPSQTRVLNLALPKPLPRESSSVRPKEVGYQGWQPLVAHCQVQGFVNPPQPSFVQSDFRYPPLLSGILQATPNPIFGGPAHAQPPLLPLCWSNIWINSLGLRG